MNFALCIFNQEYDVHIKRTYSSIVIDNYDLVERKFQVLEVGDEIRFNCVPANNQQESTYIDVLDLNVEMM